MHPRVEHTRLVVIGTDYIYSCTSNYHAITTTTSLVFILCVVFVNITLHKMEAVSIPYQQPDRETETDNAIHTAVKLRGVKDNMTHYLTSK
jgi:hypothetical protein